MYIVYLQDVSLVCGMTRFCKRSDDTTRKLDRNRPSAVLVRLMTLQFYDLIILFSYVPCGLCATQPVAGVLRFHFSPFFVPLSVCLFSVPCRAKVVHGLGRPAGWVGSGWVNILQFSMGWAGLDRIMTKVLYFFLMITQHTIAYQLSFSAVVEKFTY